jgi:outer membrane biosynthesis protein TonB
MDGRLSVGGEVKALQDLKNSGKVKKGDTGYYVPLSPSSRGRIQMGEVTILFQFVTPPPKRPQPVLPSSMKGGWIQGVGGALMGMIALSALIQGGFVLYVQSQDWPEPKEMETSIPDRFVELSKKKKEPPEPEKKKKKAEPKESSEAEAKAEAPQPSPSPEPSNEDKKDDKKKKKDEMSPEEKAKQEAKRQRQMAKEVKNKTIIGQLGHVSKDGGGTVADVLSDGAGKKNMDEAFANSEGVTSGTGAEKSGLSTSGSSDAEGSGEATGIGELGKTSGAKEAGQARETGQKKEEKVEASMDLKQPAQKAGTGQLDSSSISSVIKRRASRIQQCYERQLKVNPKLSGKVIVNFTIGRAGRVTQSKAVTDTVGSGVGSCVAQVVKGFRFPRPKGGNVMVNKTFVFASGN